MTDLPTLLIVALLVFGIGVSLGLSGYGGFLVGALLVAVMGWQAQPAIGHGLLSFVLPGAIGTYMYWRSADRPPWSLVLLLCAGSVPGTFVGRLLSTTADERTLQLSLGLVVLVAGVAPLARGRRRTMHGETGATQLGPYLAAVVFAGGLLAGIATVLTGIGGPLITVPLLLLIGIGPTAAVGAALFNALIAATLGAAVLLPEFDVDPLVLVTITATQLAGVPVGVLLHRRVEPARVVAFVAAASSAVGVWLVWHALF